MFTIEITLCNLSSGPSQQSSQQPPSTCYDSENEADPRVILDRDTTKFYDGEIPIATSFQQLLERSPMRNVDALRPLPNDAAVADVRPRMRAKGKFVGTRFDVVDNLQYMFTPRNVKTIGVKIVTRFCLRQNFVTRQSYSKTMLIYTDGTSDRAGSSGGCALKFGNSSKDTVVFPLEKQGPDGSPCRANMSRARFRAVLAALTYKDWYREGWTCVVIQTPHRNLPREASASLSPLGDLAKELDTILADYVKNGCEVSFAYMSRADLTGSPLDPQFADKALKILHIPTEYQTRPTNCIVQMGGSYDGENQGICRTGLHNIVEALVSKIGVPYAAFAPLDRDWPMGEFYFETPLTLNEILTLQNGDIVIGLGVPDIANNAFMLA
ncbi:hypothetical protein FHL15_001166 [Xylaria flabelliformis]|uniref:Uncharacterized protein n=1 Tax=Xylaria flabelliformis TaxID=2512241 RepID=A0A553ICN9_9PEZI|nr:hypothetical protein FHL15_001166 [Xylaria flabelliformis]